MIRSGPADSACVAYASRLTPSTEGQQVRRWLMLWSVFASLGFAWAIAIPLFDSPDEPAHVVYAAAAVRGEVWATTVSGVTRVAVPRSFAGIDDVARCIHAGRSAQQCWPRHAEGGPKRDVSTTAGRYPPVYYWISGIPSLVFKGEGAVYAMRLATGALVAAFLASAASSVIAKPRRLAVLALCLAITPMLYFFAGSVNPQGPEI